MSVSQYPNATPDAVEQMTDLLDQMIPTPAPQGLEDDTTLAVSAYLCGAIEHIIRLPTVAKMDPKALAQIKSILRSCT